MSIVVPEIDMFDRCVEAIDNCGARTLTDCRSRRVGGTATIHLPAQPWMVPGLEARPERRAAQLATTAYGDCSQIRRNRAHRAHWMNFPDALVSPCRGSGLSESDRPVGICLAHDPKTSCLPARTFRVADSLVAYRAPRVSESEDVILPHQPFLQIGWDPNLVRLCLPVTL